MLVSSVLGKSGLASPDAPIAGALSALRAPVARATGFVNAILPNNNTGLRVVASRLQLRLSSVAFRGGNLQQDLYTAPYELVAA